jgi:serine-type D-Ala-D-Ala carboxypeptidase (penicillin-binding protein 5/6)
MVGYLMKFAVHLLALVLNLVVLNVHAVDLPVPPPPKLEARAWLLQDMQSGDVLASERADERMEPASLTKLMTAYLSFAALKSGRIKPTDSLPISERAWKAEGSRMFLDPRKPAKVEELLKGMIVQSGNDASIVLAEGIAGSEEGFASMMNQEAKRLGMKQTHFMNATGLPDPEHYTTAADLAILTAALIRDYPDFYKLYSIPEYTYNNITQPNRNQLLRLDPHVDGVKTGHTESAGFCLVASAKRRERRLLSVVLGAKSERARTLESQRLLNYGFQFTDSVRMYRGGQVVKVLQVWKGEKNEVKTGFADDFFLTLPKGAYSRVKAKLESRQPLVAPIKRGKPVAIMHLFLDDKPLGSYALVALESVEVAGLFGRMWDSLQLMLQ